jgi:NAD(P)H-hydrate epimerase
MLTRAQVRNLDRIAVERFGIPGIVLMENAGRGATDVLCRRFSPSPGETILILAGRGNNGGDGFVIARHLAIRGFRPEIALLGERADFRGPGEAGTNFAIVEKLAIPLTECPGGDGLSGLLEAPALVVDAVLGTGLTGEVRGAPRQAVAAMNAGTAPVFAVDIPSGLDCDSGLPLGIAVRARATVTFAAMKVGFSAEGADRYTGPVDVVDIGTPPVWE